MKEVYIVLAKRTAIGSYLGSLSSMTATQLGEKLIANIMETAKLPRDAIDEVIIGQVLTAGQGQNPARQAMINAGLNEATPAMTINKVCGSGLKSIALAYDSIAIGNNDLVIAGGQESMSTAFHGALIRQNVRMGDIKLIDLMSYDGLTDAFSYKAMGVTAENVAEKYGISRQEQDIFALESQKKASNAIAAGYFKEEILPIKVQTKKMLVEFAEDEFVKPQTNIDSLSKLKTVFKENGTVTAGNASGINDGAAMLLLASKNAIKKFNLKPLVRVLGHASAGVAPEIMGIAPSAAVQKLVDKTKINLDVMDLIEANEAFAAPSIAVNKLLGWDVSKVNITGGAIALGHPIGASGARVATTLIHNMIRNRAKTGLATLCIGGGMGIAMSFELI